MKKSYVTERFPMLYNADTPAQTFKIIRHDGHSKKNVKRISPALTAGQANAFMPPQATGYLRVKKHEHF